MAKGTRRSCTLTSRPLPPLQDAFGQYNDVCPHGDPGELIIPRFDPVSNPVRLASVLNLREADAPDVIARMLSERLVNMGNVRRRGGEEGRCVSMGNVRKGGEGRHAGLAAPTVTPALLTPTPQKFLELSDPTGVRRRVAAAAAASPNRLCANAELDAPVVDLRALPPPHLISGVLLTGSMVVSVGADAAAKREWEAQRTRLAQAERRGGDFASDPLAGGVSGGGSGEEDAGGPVNTMDTGLDNFIAAHSDRKLVPPPPPPPVPAGAIAPPAPEPVWAWTYDLPAVATYLLSRYMAGRAKLGASLDDGEEAGGVGSARGAPSSVRRLSRSPQLLLAHAHTTLPSPYSLRRSQGRRRVPAAQGRARQGGEGQRRRRQHARGPPAPLRARACRAAAAARAARAQPDSRGLPRAGEGREER